MKKQTVTKGKAATKGQRAKDKAIAPIQHMPATSIKALAQGLCDVEVIRLAQYDHVARSLAHGLVSGANNAQLAEYTYRMNTFGKLLASMREIDAESVKRSLRRALARVGFRAPTKERDEDDKAKAERAKAATVKAIARAKTEIKKQQPRITPEMLEVKAKEVVAEKREAETDAGKQATRRAKVISILDKMAVQFKEGELGNGDARPVLERLAAFKASVADFS